MTDIVERLRRVVRGVTGILLWRPEVTQSRNCRLDLQMVTQEAADEIERLRADVQKLLKTCRGYEGANGKLRAENAKLRNALTLARTAINDGGTIKAIALALKQIDAALQKDEGTDPWAADEIERLRKESAIHYSNTLAAIDDCNDALDEIAKLREENAKLKRLREAALEEAAKFVEENYEEEMINIVGNHSWRERGPKKLAAAIRTLKDEK